MAKALRQMTSIRTLTVSRVSDTRCLLVGGMAARAFASLDRLELIDSVLDTETLLLLSKGRCVEETVGWPEVTIGVSDSSCLCCCRTAERVQHRLLPHERGRR